MINAEKLDLWITRYEMHGVGNLSHSQCISCTLTLSWISDSVAGKLASSICCGNCSEIFVEVQDPQPWQQAESIHSYRMSVF